MENWFDLICFSYCVRAIEHLIEFDCILLKIKVNTPSRYLNRFNFSMILIFYLPNEYLFCKLIYYLVSDLNLQKNEL